MAWYLKYQLKSDQLLKKLVTLGLCYVKIWINVDEPRTAELDYLLNHSTEEEQVAPVMVTHCSLSDCP